jgi:polysaccharide export outer membrane protein
VSISHRKPLRPAFLTLMTALAISAGLDLPAMAQGATPYRVGPGDTLSIVTYGNAALTGLYAVDNSGTIGYPIIGHMAVAGMTVSEAGDAITSALLEHVPGLIATVSVSSYAPVFVLGDVSTPGSYQYRPGMIALELLALGGGMRKSTDVTQNLGLQFISTRQEYQDQSLQLFALTVKRKRIEAERDHVAFIFKLPADTPQEDRADRQAIIDAEGNILAVRASTAQAEDDGISAQEASFKAEIETITEGIKLHDEEIASLEEDVAGAQSLVDRKLATDTSLRVVERTLSATKRDALELQSAKARAEQSLLDLGLRRTILANTRQNEAAGDLRDLEIEISRDTASLKSLMDSMGELASLDSAAASRLPMSINYSITRLVEGQRTQIAATETTEILPGDILQATALVGGGNSQDD